MIDNRASPGVAPKGQPLGEGALFEAATYTCSHCQRVVVLNPDRTRERAYCPKCDRRICDGCEAERVAAGGACLSMTHAFDIAQEQAERGVSVEHTIRTLRRTIYDG